MKMLRMALLSSVLALGLSVVAPGLRAADATKNIAGKMLRDASLMLLKEGNERFATGRPQHPNLDLARRSSTASSGQEPFASILACADSRSPVELVFDRGVGDLFVIRVAGHVADDSELASLEYGVEHLNTPILVVLGHTRCGAVTAVAKGAELPGHLHHLGELIEPAARKARTEATGADELVPRAIQAHVWNTLERVLRESSLIREKAEAGSVHLVGALYDLDTGRVSWMGAHPAQEAIIALANQAKTDAALAASKESFAPASPKRTGGFSPAVPNIAGNPPPASRGAVTRPGTLPAPSSPPLPELGGTTKAGPPRTLRSLAGSPLEPAAEPHTPTAPTRNH